MAHIFDNNFLLAKFADQESFAIRAKRLGRQVLFIPRQAHWLNTETKTQLKNAVACAEMGHAGEICLLIEKHLPVSCAFWQTSYQRAIELFASQHVWDTANNTGVLVYVNLCERTLHILADRGIADKTHSDTWQQLRDDALDSFLRGDFSSGLNALLAGIGEQLRIHFPSTDRHGNELPDHPIYLP